MVSMVQRRLRWPAQGYQRSRQMSEWAVRDRAASRLARQVLAELSRVRRLIFQGVRDRTEERLLLGVEWVAPHALVGAVRAGWVRQVVQVPLTAPAAVAL